jgi:anti-sigma B factor antagonist
VVVNRSRREGCLVDDLYGTQLDRAAVARVALSGEYDVSRVDEVLDLLVQQTSARVVEVDMSGVEFIDSSGFGALIRAQDRLVLDGRHLRLVGVPERVRTLMELVGLVEFLDAQEGDA